MMKRVFAPWALAVLLHAAPAHAATDKTTEIPVLIAESIDPRGNPLPTPPIIAAVVNLLAEETGLNLVIRGYPWRRAQVMAEQGEGLLYGAASTPERLRVFQFTKPVYDANQWLVSSAQAPLIFHHWEDLQDKVISIGVGGKYGPEFEARREKLFRIEQDAASTENRLKMLSTHRVDAVLLDDLTPLQVRECVEVASSRVHTQVTGDVRLDAVRSFAQAGVDRIAVDALTQRAPALDLELEFEAV